MQCVNCNGLDRDQGFYFFNLKITQTPQYLLCERVTVLIHHFLFAQCIKFSFLFNSQISKLILHHVHNKTLFKKVIETTCNTTVYCQIVIASAKNFTEMISHKYTACSCNQHINKQVSIAVSGKICPVLMDKLQSVL